ncbi:hypothetical protein PV327_008758 [Microctonus hyperodae]|uniref:Uncharacterized protein n=1 Tax=Microctonus hyperodae TaxID=165561 RepID=A0AA39KV99_MICHY|nr:hypothetical protein PV327_008758 [Microctonus hyperodae]
MHIEITLQLVVQIWNTIALYALAGPYDHHHEPNIKSAHSRSEPRLSDNASPSIKKRISRRGHSMHHVNCKKGNAFLDVPNIGSQSQTEKVVKEFLQYRRYFSPIRSKLKVSLFLGVTYWPN